MRKFFTRFFLVVILAAYTFLGCEAANSSYNSQDLRPAVNLDERLTIVISSCDKYSELWPIFFDQLFANWPALRDEHSKVDIILVSNSQSYDNSRVRTILSDKNKNWGGNMLEALSAVKTQYVLYLQEDYFITHKIDIPRIVSVVNAMEKHRAAYTGLVHDSSANFSMPNKALSGSTVKAKNAEYRTSLQAAIWDLNALKWLLVADENPWQFEITGNIRSQGMMQEFWILDDASTIQYVNVVDKGFVNNNSLKALNGFGIKYTPQKLPINTDHPFLYYLAINKPKQYKQWQKLQERIKNFF